MSISDYGAQIKQRDTDGNLYPIYPITKVEYVEGNIVKTINGEVPNAQGNIDIDIPTNLPASGGNADTVNGFTVQSDVPPDAKFTDTIYVLPTATNDVLGGVMVDSSLTLNSGVLSITGENIVAALGYTPIKETTFTNTASVKIVDSGTGDLKLVSLGGNDLTIDAD